MYPSLVSPLFSGLTSDYIHVEKCVAVTLQYVILLLVITMYHHWLSRLVSAQEKSELAQLNSVRSAHAQLTLRPQLSSAHAPLKPAPLRSRSAHAQLNPLSSAHAQLNPLSSAQLNPLSSAHAQLNPLSSRSAQPAHLSSVSAQLSSIHPHIVRSHFHKSDMHNTPLWI